MRRHSALFSICTLTFMFLTTSVIAETTSSGNNNTPGESDLPKNVIRRSPRQQPIMVDYHDGIITVSVNQSYENVEMTIINVETGEQYEITLGIVDEDVSVPILMMNGEYQLSLMCDQTLYSFTINIEEN